MILKVLVLSTIYYCVTWQWAVLLLYQVLLELNIAFNLRKVWLRIRPGFMSFISACNLDFHMKIPSSASLPQVTIQRNYQTRVHSAEVVVCREGG